MEKENDQAFTSNPGNANADVNATQTPNQSRNTPASSARNSKDSGSQGQGRRVEGNTDIQTDLWKEHIRQAIAESRQIARLQAETSTQTPKLAQIKINAPKTTRSYYDRLKEDEHYTLRLPHHVLSKAKSTAGMFAGRGRGRGRGRDPSRPISSTRTLGLNDTDEEYLPGSSTHAFLRKGKRPRSKPKSPMRKMTKSKSQNEVPETESEHSVDDGGNVLSYFDPRYVKPEFVPLLVRSRNIAVGPPSEVLRKYFGYGDDDVFPEEFLHDDSPRAFILPRRFWKDYDDVMQEAAPVRTLNLLHDTSSKAVSEMKKKKEEEEEKKTKRGFDPDKRLIEDMQEDDKRPQGFVPRQPKNFAVEYLARQPFKKYGMIGSNLNDASPGMLEHWEMKPLAVDPGGHLQRDPGDRRFKISEVTGTPVKVGPKEEKLTDDKRPWYHEHWAESMDPELRDNDPEYDGYAEPSRAHDAGRRHPRDRDYDRPDGERRPRGRGGPGEDRRPSMDYSDDGSDVSGYSCTCGSYSSGSSSSGSSSGSTEEGAGSTGEGASNEGSDKDGDPNKKRSHRKPKHHSKGRKKHGSRKRGKGKDKDDSESEGDKEGKEHSERKHGIKGEKGDNSSKKKEAGTDPFTEPVPEWAPDAWKSPEGFRGWFFKNHKGKGGSISAPDLPEAALDKNWLRALYLVKKAQDDANVDEIKEAIGDSDSAKAFLQELEEEFKRNNGGIEEDLDPMLRLPRDIPTAREYPEHTQPANFNYYKSYPLYPTISNERYFEWFKDVDRLEDPRRKRVRVRPAGLSKSVGNINWDDPKQAAKWYAYGYRRPDTAPKPERADYDTRDYVYDNARSITIMPPRKPIPKYIDDRKGTEHLLEPSGLIKKYVFREDFGKMPDYLMDRNSQLGRPAMPDFDKFYRPHRCKFLHGHIHCKICRRAHPTVKHRKVDWECEMEPCCPIENSMFGGNTKYQSNPNNRHYIRTEPDYSEYFDINNLIKRIAQNNQGGFLQQGCQQNFYEYFKDDSRCRPGFRYNSPPVYV